MKQKLQILTGVLIVVLGVTVLGFFPVKGELWMCVTALLAVAVTISGPEGPLTLRVAATGFIACFGFQVCLEGRVTEPYLTTGNVGAALFYFAAMAGLPLLAMLQCWEGRTRVLVVALIPAVSLLLACAVAAYEESMFIARHENGSGMIDRWTVWGHWLAYDAATGTLTGGD